MAQQQLLLLQDVDSLGRQGDVVKVKPGFARNFLLPKGFAVRADRNALRRVETLQAERRERAAVDLKESEAIAARLEGLVVETEVKVDQDGHMYGSVSLADLHQLLLNQHKLELGKRDIQLKHPIKKLGEHTIAVKLKEGVEASFTVRIVSENGATEEPKKEENAS